MPENFAHTRCYGTGTTAEVGGKDNALAVSSLSEMVWLLLVARK
jgi:hypothetical protein